MEKPGPSSSKLGPGFTRRCLPSRGIREPQPGRELKLWLIDAGGAVNAALVLGQEVTDLGEQLIGGRGRSILWDAGTALLQFVQLVHRDDEDEVNNQRDDEEVDCGGNDRTEVNKGSLVSGANLEAQALYFGGAQGSDDWVDEVIGERGNDRGECGTDDNRDGELDDVATHDEVFKALEHMSALSK